MTALFPLAPVPRWTGSRALVPLDRTACPSCAGLTTTVTVAEPTLFRHAGHGAVRETTSRVCVSSLRREARCGWGITTDVSEVNPRAYGVVGA
jgi:hypothetical protein